MWQDTVISIGQVIFLLALLPSIFSKNKPAWGTSFLTALILSIFAFTFWTLSLKWGMISSGMVALGWWVLFFQALALPRR